jgi:hypothetical protein
MIAGDADIDWSVTVADLVSSAGIVVAVLLAWWQLRKANKQNRAQFVVSLLTEYTSDPEGLELLYKIEYQEWKFDKEAFAGSSDEKSLDKLLYSFQQISALYEMGTITRKDLRLIEYDFLRVYCDPEVQKYFDFLDCTPHGLPTDQADFHAYRRVSGKLSTSFQRKKRLKKIILRPIQAILGVNSQ